MPDTFFRIRRYLRNLQENDFVHYTVQYENGEYTISYWGYPEHPRPTASQLSQITTNQVLEEKKSMIREHHINDIYTFQSGHTTPTTYTVVRNNACSLLSGREIRLSNVGYYRITVAGKCQGEMDIKLMNAERESIQNAVTMHVEKVLANNEYYNFISIIKTDTPQERMYLNFVVSQISGESYNINGTVIVEFIK
jgi:hypothetical protein